jgi:adenylate cyclase class 2
MSQAPETGKLNLEIEVKLACGDLERFIKAGLSLRLETPRHFEDNWLLDLPDGFLFKQGAALRVRLVNGAGTVTYKGVVKETHESRLKVREEIETAVDEPTRLIELFERLGYQRSFRYQKYRTGYIIALDEVELKLEFDETPMGNFIEVEGDEKGVLKALDTAGFSASDIIRESYPEIQAARCSARGVSIEDLVFK